MTHFPRLLLSLYPALARAARFQHAPAASIQGTRPWDAPGLPARSFDRVEVNAVHPQTSALHATQGWTRLSPIGLLGSVLASVARITPAFRPEGTTHGRAARFVLALFAVAFLSAAALAQRVSWDPPAGSLGRGQTSELGLIFEDCSPSGAPALPAIAGLQFGRPSQRSETSIVNFKMSQRVSLVYPVAPTGSGSVVIPEFEVDTDKGKLRVAAATYEIGDATVGRTNVPIERVAAAQLAANPSTVWAGQVFDLQYQLLVSRRYNPTNVGILDWTPPAPLVVEPWAKFEMINATVGGETRVGVATQTRAYLKEAGTLALPVARQTIDLSSGGSAFDFFGGRPNTEQFLITSSVPTVQVKPLPTPVPADFLQAVGQFTFTSKVVPTTVAVGEPITWTLTLAGMGNWPEGLTLPPREVSRDFRAFRPDVQKKVKDGTLFEATLTEDVVLMPTKPGTYTLGPVSFSSFDPKSGTYKTVRTEAVKVIVTPAAASAASITTPNGTAPVFQFTPDTNATTAANPVVKSPAPTLPGHLPMEPLTGSARGGRPSAGIAPAALLAPLPVLLLLWLGLGYRRSRLTDARRAQREALAALPGALAAVQRAQSPADQAAPLREWQRTAALAWGTGHAAPALGAFNAAVQSEIVGATADTVATWARLWTEAEAAIYGRQVPLPPDWATRALMAQSKARLRRRRFFAPLRPSNLWPLLLGALLVAAPRAEAAGPAEGSYRNGEFALAEQAWRASVAVSPDDWMLRHNLALAIAQQGRWSEATAHWSTAFLAAPRDPSVRWHLALGLEKAEFTQPEFAQLSVGTGLARVARAASPAEWQKIVLTGSALLGLAFSCVLIARHYPHRRRLPWAAAVLTFGGVAALVTGFVALHFYGPLAQPNAVLVWQATELRSIPTEAGEQKTEPLAAGTIALAIKPFFGWEQLSFPNGQTGWIRREHLQPLYPKK
ncbi:MAG: BatD family protein [Opitutaceae bacterium]|nr:BatD family protein [Opitutaceae bacterium]